MKGSHRKLPCLFLDRDGVINQRRPDDYVRTWDQFIFLPGVLDALKELRDYFYPIIIITNQQGIGKGLMTNEQVEAIHRNMKRIIRKNGGRIDLISYCPDLAELNSPCRKPNTGMGLEAKKIFPAIEFETAWMVGDSNSDIQFGNNLGMRTVLITEAKKDPNRLADFVFKDLKDFYLNFVIKRWGQVQ